MSDQVRLRPDAVEWREVEGEIVVLDLRASTYFAVNGSGAAIWPALAAGATTEELVARLVDAFGVDPEVARRDVDAFVASIRDQGLLEDGR